MKRFFKFLFVLVGLSCKDPFEPPVSSEQAGYLAVDGMINATDAKATVKLSRAVSLSSSEEFPIVEDAIVTIERKDGIIYPLPYKAKGVYELTSIPFAPDEKYKLRIELSDGKKYYSDDIPVLKTPEIDTVLWQPFTDGVNLYVSSKGSSESSNYYRWKYVETWQYNSSFASVVEIINEEVRPRDPEQQIYICWATHQSTEVLIKSTELFSSNLVDNFRLTFLPVASQRLSNRYSILVEQTSLTQEAYNFWDQIRKLSQGTGGLFDPLPSSVTGNIHSETDVNEVVLGYFSASTTSTQRIFFSFYELPAYLQRSSDFLNCKSVEIPLGAFSARDKSLMIISGYGTPLMGYTFSTVACVDCRYQGGSNIKPSFWN